MTYEVTEIDEKICSRIAQVTLDCIFLKWHYKSQSCAISVQQESFARYLFIRNRLFRWKFRYFHCYLHVNNFELILKSAFTVILKLHSKMH